MRVMHTHSKGIFYLVISLLTFAFSHIIQKLGVQSGVDPSIFSFFTVFFSLLLVGCMWFALRKKQSLTFDKPHMKNLIIIGVLVSGITVLISINALSYTTATNKGVMQGMFTAVTVLLAYFWLHERLPRLYYPMLALVIAGVILLTSNGLLQAPNKGDLLLFLTIPMVGFCNVYAKKTMKGINSLTVSFGRYIFGALFLFLILPFVGLEHIATLQNGMIWVVLSGLISGIRVVTFYKGVELEGPAIAATMLSISPVITAIADFFIIGVVLSSLQWLGLLVAVFGAVFIARMKATYK